jgi:hypothetical protein
MGMRQLGYPDLNVVDISDGETQPLFANPAFDGPGVVVWGKKILFSFAEYSQGVKRIYDFDPAVINDDGYRSFIGPNGAEYRYIAGGGYFLLFSYNREQYGKDLKRERDGSHGVLKYPYFGFADDGILSIRASSEMEETIDDKRISYNASNMRYPAFVSIEDSMWVMYNQVSPPWAARSAGHGIGETLDIAFSRSTNEVDVLNGYVDLLKPYLYRQNNRLKRIRIISEDPAFDVIYDFDDVVKIHEIKLPASTKKIRIYVLDVFRGRKFDDLCVSKIFIPQIPVRPRAQYDGELEKALIRAGIPLEFLSEP